jgi:large subunit ribosomal protein L10
MKQEKQLLLNEVKDQIDQVGSFVIMSYLKFTANKANDFRRLMTKNGAHLEVVRKRVLIKAANAAGVTLDLAQLPGHIGLVFASQDVLETTKDVFKFSKDNDKVIQVIGGRVEGQLYNAVDMETLSKLPSKDEMRAQFLATLEAPMSHTLSVMEAVLASVVYCLDNKCKQESSDTN